MTLLPPLLRHRVRRFASMAALTLLLAAPAHAHEVVNTVQRQQAVAVTLQYSDGEPFSYETYELYAGQSTTPVQTGRTDARGRVVFLPGEEQAMRLRAFSADGHGVDLRFTVPAGSADRAAGSSATAGTLDRPTRLLAGLAAILALFAAWQLFVRHRNRS